MLGKIWSTKNPFQQSVFLDQFPYPSRQERKKKKNCHHSDAFPWEIRNIRACKCILYVSSGVLITAHKHALPLEQSEMRIWSIVLITENQHLHKKMEKNRTTNVHIAGASSSNHKGKKSQHTVHIPGSSSHRVVPLGVELLEAGCRTQDLSAPWTPLVGTLLMVLEVLSGFLLTYSLCRSTQHSTCKFFCFLLLVVTMQENVFQWVGCEADEDPSAAAAGTNTSQVGRLFMTDLINWWTTFSCAVVSCVYSGSPSSGLYTRWVGETKKGLLHHLSDFLCMANYEGADHSYRPQPCAWCNQSLLWLLFDLESALNSFKFLFMHCGQDEDVFLVSPSAGHHSPTPSESHFASLHLLLTQVTRCW